MSATFFIQRLQTFFFICISTFITSMVHTTTPLCAVEIAAISSQVEMHADITDRLLREREREREMAQCVSYIPIMWVGPHWSGRLSDMLGAVGRASDRRDIDTLPLSHNISSIHKRKQVKLHTTVYGLETHHRATERHLPYGNTQRYLPPDTGERAPP